VLTFIKLEYGILLARNRHILYLYMYFIKALISKEFFFNSCFFSFMLLLQLLPFVIPNHKLPNIMCLMSPPSGHLVNGIMSQDNGVGSPPVSVSDIRTTRGQEIYQNLKKAYAWKDQFETHTQEFLSLMDRLYMECQLHLTALSSRDNVEYRREADMIVQEMIIVRNQWGPELLPNSICNAFVRERIPVKLNVVPDRQYRIDCAQFFEPVPFYGPQQVGNPGELMKLFRFSVYDLLHVLCFTCENCRGQVHPYGTEIPSYWDIRQRMLGDVYSRLQSAIAPSNYQPPQPHITTIYPQTQSKGNVVIQVASH